jgi:Flp pilus assembly protein TadG
LVEFAIVLPVLVLIILGILYFGRYEDYANQETQLAEEGVRWAAVANNPSTTGQTLQNYILSQAQPELRNGDSDVTAAKVYIYYPTGSGNTVGNPIRVCVVSTFQLPFLSTSETVAQTGTMRVEVVNGTSSPAFTVDSTIPPSCSTS